MKIQRGAPQIEIYQLNREKSINQFQNHRIKPSTKPVL